LKTESRTVYIADDDSIFETAAACEAHEAELLKRKHAISNLKVWRVVHGFDETEGRGYFSDTLIVTDAGEPVLLQWCLDNFGQPLASWYGDSFYEQWHLRKLDKDVSWAMQQDGKVLTYNRAATKLVTISKKDWTWAKLPKSTFPWPRGKS
jgi:hypothetical protein